MNKIDKIMDIALRITKEQYGQKNNWVWHEQSMLDYGTFVLKYIDAGQNDSNDFKTLDVGYGWGTMSIACNMLISEVYALDLFLPPPDFHGINWLYPIDVQNPHFKLEQRFDYILLLEVLEHFNFCVAETLIRLVNMLKDDGKLIIATPDKVRFGEDLDDIKLPMFNKNVRIQDKHMRFYDYDDLNYLNILSKIEIGPRNLFIVQK